MSHLIIIFFVFISLPLLSCENDIFSKFTRASKMTTEEFIKTNDASKLARETIELNSKMTFMPAEELKQFKDYMLNEAPERIRLLYAIRILYGDMNDSIYTYSTGLPEQYYRDLCIALFRHKIAQIDAESKPQQSKTKK
jgi:hypothetical protein